MCCERAVCLSRTHSSSEVGGSAGEVDSSQRIESFESFLHGDSFTNTLLIGTE